jgi:drug/metabolite transporter (DMT)-like permease
MALSVAFFRERLSASVGVAAVLGVVGAAFLTGG